MKCPICAKLLVKQDDTFLCEQHGMLLSGRVLHQARSQKINPTVDKDASKTRVSNTPSMVIVCPNCSSNMTPVDYVHTGIIIDSCPTCEYRWLDKGEMEKILAHKPQLNPKQLLELEEFDRNAQKKFEAKDDKIAHFVLYRHVAPMAVRATGGGGGRFPAIAGAGIYGLIRAMMHSTFYRVLVLIVILVFGLFYWYVMSVLK